MLCCTTCKRERERGAASSPCHHPYNYTHSNRMTHLPIAGDTAWRYPLESHLHELMLQSPHRTLDPEEADFFYVPVYASCFMEAVAGWADAPWWHVQRYGSGA